MIYCEICGRTRPEGATIFGERLRSHRWYCPSRLWIVARFFRLVILGAPWAFGLRVCRYDEVLLPHSVSRDELSRLRYFDRDGVVYRAAPWAMQDPAMIALTRRVLARPVMRIGGEAALGVLRIEEAG